MDFNPLPPSGGRHIMHKIKEKLKEISIHSLQVEGDLNRADIEDIDNVFQSTPSKWRETI